MLFITATVKKQQLTSIEIVATPVARVVFSLTYSKKTLTLIHTRPFRFFSITACERRCAKRPVWWGGAEDSGAEEGRKRENLEGG